MQQFTKRYRELSEAAHTPSATYPTPDLVFLEKKSRCCMERWYWSAAQDQPPTRLPHSIRIRNGRLSILLDLRPETAMNVGRQPRVQIRRVLGSFLFNIIPQAMFNGIGTCPHHVS